MRAMSTYFIEVWDMNKSLWSQGASFAALGPALKTLHALHGKEPGTAHRLTETIRIERCILKAPFPAPQKAQPPKLIYNSKRRYRK